MADKAPTNTATSASSSPERAGTTDAATKEVLNAGAGVPSSLDAAVDALPEKDAVQKAYKAQMKADTTQAETKAKVTIVKESPDADQTPSGAALLAAASESDPIKQGEKYSRVKRAVRLGSVEDAANVK